MREESYNFELPYCFKKNLFFKWGLYTNLEDKYYMDGKVISTFFYHVNLFSLLYSGYFCPF